MLMQTKDCIGKYNFIIYLSILNYLLNNLFNRENEQHNDAEMFENFLTHAATCNEQLDAQAN